jgi:transposase
MARPAKTVVCTDEEIEHLQHIANGMKTEKRLVDRARIILACADGMEVQEVAKTCGCSAVTVIKWKNRFLEKRIDGLFDEERSGRPEVYSDSDILSRISSLTATPAPDGYSAWTGDQLAERIGCSADTVWRLMREKGICLDRQRSWCVSTDPSFESKAADIVGLYLNPPENALVISVDEKPGMQALSRKTGFVVTSSKKIVTGINSTYRRNGTVNLFAALDIATGAIKGKSTKCKKREDFLSFMDDVIKDNTEKGDETQEIDVILDNYCTHKRCEEWLKAHPNVHFHYTPTSASWLNMVEIWFNIMSRSVLKNASFDSTEDLSAKIKEYIDAYNENPHPFKWRKRIVRGSEIANSLANLIN